MSGVLRRPDGLVAEWVDPLAHLPEPPDDLNLFRTYPGAPDTGAVTWTEDGELLRFTAVLPRRWGTIGATGRGLFASGGWYPQPITEDGLPILDWEVTVHLPDEAGGALGDTVGSGTLRWSGEGERAPLAAVRRPRITPVTDDVQLLTRGRPRRVLVRELQRELPRAEQGGPDLAGVVVEAPLRRRLTGASPGLAYVSDRAFRVTPGLERFHRVGVVRGLAGALLEEPDPFERDLAAAAIGRRYASARSGGGAQGLLGKLSWLPQINAILSSRRMPFYGEILETTHPTDPVEDDLVEALDPYTAGTVVVAQLDDTFGHGTGERLGMRLARGEPLERAAEAEGVPWPWIAAWRRPYPDQDYTLEIDRDRSVVEVRREAPPTAQTETIVVRVDGADVPVTVAPGETVDVVLSGPPRRVALDPAHHTAQRSRLGDSWPARYAVTFAAGIDSINLNRGQLYGVGQMTLRRQYDTRNLWFGNLYTSPGTLVGAGVTWLRKEGRLQDGWNRPHRFTLGGGVGLLDPDFANVDRIRPALTASVGYAFDTRVSTDFPLRGRRLAATVGGGTIPGVGERWGSAHLVGVGLLPLHPRHVLAGRAGLSAAASNVPWRLLSLGGTGSMRSLPVLPPCPQVDERGDPAPCAEQADLRATAAWEYRVAPLRQASIPGLLAWGNELQLTTGLEGVAARVDGGPAAALGVTAGIAGTADLFGAHTELFGITAGWPLLWTGLEEVERSWVPEIYLRWAQAF